MRRFLNLALLISVLAICAAAQKPDSSARPQPKPDVEAKLPSAGEIVAKYAKALGGREALSKPTSRYEKGTMELSPMGVKGSFESFARSDNRTLTKVTLDGIGDLLDGFDGTTAWTVNPLQGSRVKEGRELEQTKRMSTFARDVDLTKAFSSMRVRGIEKVGERDAYVVIGSSDGLPDEVMYFDVEGGLLLRRDSIVIAPEGQQSTSTFFDDYREISGIKVAHKTRITTPAFEITSTITEVKFDIPIEDAKF